MALARNECRLMTSYRKGFQMTPRRIAALGLAALTFLAISQSGAVGNAPTEDDPYESAERDIEPGDNSQPGSPKTPCGRISYGIYAAHSTNYFLDASVSDMFPRELADTAISNWSCLADDLANEVLAIILEFERPTNLLSTQPSKTWVASWLMWTEAGEGQNWRDYLTIHHEGRAIAFREFPAARAILAHDPIHVMMSASTSSEDFVSAWEQTVQEACAAGRTSTEC